MMTVYRPKRKPRRRRNRQPTTDRTSTWLTAVQQTPVFPASHRSIWRTPYYDLGLVVTPTLLLASNYFFSANGMYDPDITGTGHQPMGFDQLMTLYEQGTVLRSRISVSLIAQSACRFALWLSPDTTSVTDPIRIAENGLISSQTADGATASGTGGTGERRMNLTLSCDVAKYFGRRSGRTSIVNDPDLAFTAAANPVEQVYFVISAWHAFGSVSSSSVGFDVRIDYDVIFHEPRKLTVSLSDCKTASEASSIVHLQSECKTTKPTGWFGSK